MSVPFVGFAVAAMLAVLLPTAAAFSVPAEPYSVLYRKLFTNWPSNTDPCVLTADAFQDLPNASETAHDRATKRTYTVAGCVPPTATARFSMILMTPADITQHLAAPGLLAEKFRATTSGAGPFAIVVEYGAAAASGTAGAVQTTSVSDAFELAVKVNAAYRGAAASGPEVPQVPGDTQSTSPIGALIMRRGKHTTDIGMAEASPMAQISPYSSPSAWVRPNVTNSAGVESGVAATGAMWRSHDGLTAVLLPDTAGTTGAAVAWSKTVDHARRNTKTWVTKNEIPGAPRYIAEALYQMTMDVNPVPQSARTAAAADGTIAPSCLTIPRPTCLPIGGQSVFATTAKDTPSFVNDTTRQDGVDELRRRRPARSVLIVAPMTSTTTFHETVPAADAAAASWAAALAIGKALNTSGLMDRYLHTVVTNESTGVEWTPMQVSLLLTSADDYGLAGSGRFVKDLHNFSCAKIPGPDSGNSDVSCVRPFTWHTNFTSMNFSDFTDVIVLDQLATGPNVFVHSDKVTPPLTTAGNARQKTVEDSFVAQGALRAAGPQLPPTAAFAFYGAINAKNAAGPAAPSSWAESWAGAAQRTTLTVLSTYDATFASTWQSISDKGDNVNLATARKTADMVLSYLGDLWWSEYLAVANDTFTKDRTAPGAAATVPAVLPVGLPRMARNDFTVRIDPAFVSSMYLCWIGNTGCDLFSEILGTAGRTSKPPVSAYPGVFQFYGTIPTQAIIAKLLLVSAFAGPRATAAACPCASSMLNETCVGGQCVATRAWYHAAYSPGISPVTDADRGAVYWRQDPRTARPPSSGKQPKDLTDLIDGIPLFMLRQVWVESFWPNEIGGRIAAASSDAEAWGIFGSGVFVTALSAGLMALWRFVGLPWAKRR